MRNFAHEAKLAAERRNYQMAVDHLQVSRQETPDAVNLLILLGYFLSRLDRSPEAYSCFQDALRLEPTNARALVYVAHIYSHYHQFEKAMELCRLAVAAAPETPFVYVGLASVYDDWQRYSDALYMLEKAKTFDTDDEYPGGIEYRMGNVFLHLGDIENARDYHERSFKKDETNPDFWLARAMRQWQNNKLPDARETIEKVIGLAPEYYLSHYWMGLIELLLYHDASARTAFQTTIDLNSQYLPAHQGVLKATFKAHDYRTAMKLRKQGRELSALKKKSESDLLTELQREEAQTHS